MSADFIAFVVIALGAGAACVALVGAHLRRVLRATSPDISAFTLAMRRLPLEERAAELARRAPPGTWERRLAESLLETSSDEARIAASNDALADMESTLSAGSSWPRTAVRVCARSMLLLATIAFLVQRTAGGIFAVLVIGGAATLACIALGRRAQREAQERREAVDALVSAVLGPLAPPRRA